MLGNPQDLQLGAKDAIALAHSRGLSHLETGLAAHISTFRGPCFQKDRTIRDLLEKPQSKLGYHVGSIARARRKLANLGIIESKRLGPGAKLPKIPGKPQGHTTTGCCVTKFNWENLGQRNPHDWRQKIIVEKAKQKAKRQAAKEHKLYVAPENPKPTHERPRHSVPPESVIHAPQAKPDDKLAAILAETTANYERRWRAQQARTTPQGSAPPTDQGDEREGATGPPSATGPPPKPSAPN